MFKSLVFGILLANSAFCDDTVLREQSSEAEHLLPYLLRSPHILTNNIEVQENLAKNNASPECPNTAILLKILDILTKSLPPFSNSQLEPEKFKYVLEEVKKYLQNSTPSTKHLELYNKFHDIENLFNVVNKPVSRSSQYPILNTSPKEDFKTKVTIQFELPISSSNCQSTYECTVKYINSVYPQITKFCDTTGLCNKNIPKWDVANNADNLLHDNYHAIQQYIAAAISQLILYLQQISATQKWLNKEDNLPNSAYYDNNLKNTLNNISNNDIISLLQNYRPQESTSDNSNAQNNQISKSLLEQILSQQSPGQIHSTSPNVHLNEALNKPPGNGNVAENQISNTLLEKILSIQTPSGSGVNADVSTQNDQIQKQLIEKLIINKTPGQFFAKQQQNANTPPSSNNNVDNQLQNNQILSTLLQKLLLNQTPGQVYVEQQQFTNTLPNSNLNNANSQVQNNESLMLLLQKLLPNQYSSQNEATNLNKPQNQPINKPIGSSNNLQENNMNIVSQKYGAPDSFLQGPQLNISYTISNGRISPVQSKQENVNNYDTSTGTMVANLAENNRYALDKLLAATQLQKLNPSNAKPLNTLNNNLYPNTAANYGQLPSLYNNQKPTTQYFNSLNLQGYLNPTRFPINTLNNIQNAQYPSIGYLPNYYYLNTKQDIQNPNQQNVFNQYQNAHSNIIGLNQETRSTNPLPNGNNAYVNPYVLSSSFTDNTVQRNNGLNLADSQRLTGSANAIKLNSASDDENKLVEITYVLQRPQEVQYEPVYYIKYRIPYNKLKYNLQNLLSAKPYLQNNPNLLYQELLAQTNLTESSSNMQVVDSNNVIKLIGSNGTLIEAKLLPANETAIGEQLKIVQELNSKLDPNDVINLNIAAVNQLKHLRLSQQNNSEAIDNVVNTEGEIIANNTATDESNANPQSLGQYNLNAYSSRLINNNQPLVSSPLISGQETMRYNLPVMQQMLPNMPLAYSHNPLMYKQNLVYGK